MIYHVKGDLLASDCTFIGHQCNCMMGFGAGIAGQIRKEFTDAYRVFASDRRPSEDKLGDLTFIEEDPYWIFNLYGQYYFGGQDPKGFDTVYEAFESALNKMLIKVPEIAKLNNIDDIKIGLPYLIGCGLAGGDWSTVYSIIERQSQKHNLDIWLYEYTP